jgi:signal transduction histidine kinase
MKLNDLKLGVKLAIGFGFILVIMAGSNIFSLGRMTAIKNEIDEITANRLPRALVSADLNLNTAELRIRQLQHTFNTGAVIGKQQRDLMGKLIDRIEENRDTYERLKTESEARQSYSNEEKELYASFDRKWEMYADLSADFIQLLDENQTQKAIALLNSEAQEVFDHLSADLRALANVNKNDSNAAAARADVAYQSVRKITQTLSIGAILLSVFLVAWLARFISVPVRQLVHAARSVAGGDLDVHLKIDSKDEIGNLAHSFNLMTASLREARERMQKAQVQLVQSEKMASLGQLTAGIAHEINNPVNFVSSNVSPLRRDVAEVFSVLAQYDETVSAQQLQERFQSVETMKKKLDLPYLKEEINSLLDGIQDGAHRTSEIVKGLRSFTRLDEDERKSANINQGLESALLMLKHQLKNRIEVIKEFGDLPPVMCYPGKLNQAFLNILANASQAISGPGKIFIKTSSDGEIVTIAIKDTGAGMMPEVQKHIFEPFFTTKPVGEGTGLGLPITYGIIEAHDGNIEIYSEPGKGSEFVITLPVK